MLDEPVWTVPDVTLYASPDSSYEVLRELMAKATIRLHLHVYELRSQELVDGLVAAKQAQPNLDLQVLVDGSPVGQDAGERHQTAYALQRITEAGGHVVLSGSGRYDDWHLKVLVADDNVAVQSENWVATGVPSDSSVGNRGWGAVVHHKPAADWFAQWLANDRASWETVAFDLATFDPTFVAPGRAAPRTGEYGPIVAPLVVHDVRVTPLVAPDHTGNPATDKLAAIIAMARRSVEVQQLDLADKAANDLGFLAPDPLLEALQGAAGRVPVRVQAATPFSSTDEGNRPQLELLRQSGALAEEENRPGIVTLHNKGVLVDDTVVLGSMNGNHHSRSQNREVDLILESADAAAYFRRLFESDWSGQLAPADVGIIPEDLRGVPALHGSLLVLVLAVAVVVRAGSRR